MSYHNRRIQGRPPRYQAYDASYRWRAGFDSHASTETDPLNPHGSSIKRKLARGATFLIRAFTFLLLLLVLAGLIFYFSTSLFPLTRCNDPLDRSVRERIRREWEVERHVHEQERQKHQAELDEWNQEKLGWEREKEEIQRAGLSWSNLEGDRPCVSYGTREYTALLSNIPAGLDRLKACVETPIVIHGITWEKPDRCEDQGYPNGIIGHWTVNVNEPSCTTYWSYYKDKGCVLGGSGVRRIEAPIENLQDGDGWREMCATTPAEFNQMRFDGPHICNNWGQHGIWGVWEISDSSC